jgi:hypothetical protein
MTTLSNLTQTQRSNKMNEALKERLKKMIELAVNKTN